jgi:DNA ligase-1
MKTQGPFRPMLAASKPRDYTDEMFYKSIVFPVIATPKLDGIRCVTRDIPRAPGTQCEALSRSLKPIPNIHIAAQIGMHCPPGLDGEIMTYDHDLFLSPKMRNFNNIQSDVMSEKGIPNWKYHVFDFDIEGKDVYTNRIQKLATECMKGNMPAFIERVVSCHITSLSQLLEYEAEQVAAGYEGICWRDPNSPYKHGRSTLREGYLVKLKRFVTEEAVIVGVEEEMMNNNPQVLGETGYAERSSHKANMSGKGRMGALVCRQRHEDQIFKIGSGFTAQQRQNMWDGRDSLIGKICTFKHQPHGAKELPRIPVFVGFRDARDL